MKKTLKYWWVLPALFFIFIVPYVLTRPAKWESFNFSETGQIGDTIGGLTSPIIGLISAILVYAAFKEQIKANSLIQLQFISESLNENLNKIEDVGREMSQIVEAIQPYKYNPYTGTGFNNEQVEVLVKKLSYALHLFLQTHKSISQLDVNGSQVISERLAIVYTVYFKDQIPLIIAVQNGRQVTDNIITLCRKVQMIYDLK